MTRHKPGTLVRLNWSEKKQKYAVPNGSMGVVTGVGNDSHVTALVRFFALPDEEVLVFYDRLEVVDV